MHQHSPAFIEMFQKGNPKSIPILIMLYYDELLKFSLRITKSKSEAEEIVQDAFTVLWQRRSGFFSDLSIRKYLFKVVKNKSLNSQKKTDRRKKTLNAYAHSETELTVAIEIDMGGDDYLLIKLWREIEKLPPQPKAALSLLAKGKSIKEVAGIMKLKESTVRAIKQRGITALRKKIRSFFTTW